MTITFYTFERLWCRIVGHRWCGCKECGPGDRRCRRCTFHESYPVKTITLPLETGVVYVVDSDLTLRKR